MKGEFLMNNIDIMSWIDRLLCVSFKGKEIVEKQIKNSELTVEQNYSYISIKFKIKEGVDKFPFNIRVPLEMRIFQKTAAPIVFLLHIVNGIVNELEIITADSSEIDISNLQYQKVEYEINEELII